MTTGWKHVGLAAGMAWMASALFAPGLQAQASERALRLETQPSTVLSGDTAGGYALRRVRMAIRTRTGYAIADPVANSVGLFDSAGRFLRAMGRKGRGPGEFQSANWVGQCAGDSLFVWDAQEFRVSVFTGSGTFVRLFRAPINAHRADCAPESKMIGLLMFPRSGNPPDPSRRAVDSVDIRLINHDGDSVGVLQGIPFGDGAIFGALTDFTMRGSKVVVGAGTGPYVDEYSTSGMRVRRLPVPHTPRKTSREQHARVIDQMLDAVGVKGARRDAQRQALLAMPIPEYFPPYREIRLSPSGVLWISTGTPEDGDSAATLTAIGANGRVLARAVLPMAVRLLSAGDDHLMLTYYTDDDEPRVGVFPVRPVR